MSRWVEVAGAWGEGIQRALMRRPDRVLLSLGVVFFVAVVLSQSGYMPIWDSWEYAVCVLEATAHPQELARYSCASHFTHIYCFLLTLPGHLGSPGMGGLLAVNALLGMGSLLALHDIARTLLPDQRFRLDCALVACAWAVHPIHLSSALFINPDFGVMAFILMSLAFLLRGKPNEAALLGIGAAFSKETGGLLYVIMAASYLVLAVGRGQGTRAERWAHFKDCWPLLAPVLAILAYVLLGRPMGASLWGSPTLSSMFDQLTTFRLLAGGTLAAAATIFVLSFAWIPTSVILLDLLHGSLFWCLGHSAPTPEAVRTPAAGVVLAVTAFATFALTRFQTTVLPRYFTILYALLLLVFLRALLRLGFPQWVRRLLLGCLVVLLGLSSFRTLDPVSARLYGTFPFGDHRMLAMTTLNHELGFPDPNQLVYNLEFARLPAAIDEALPTLQPTWQRPVVLPNQTNWNLLIHMNPETWRRSLPIPGAARLPHFQSNEFPRQSPPELSFLVLPIVDSSRERRGLEATYEVVTVERHGGDGYWMEVVRMRRRGVK